MAERLHGGHSRGDLGKYRPEAELQSWLARDPIPAYRSRLLAAGVPEPELAAIESNAIALVDAAERAVRSAPAPCAESLLTDVWADGGSAWRN